jgi:anti-sigma-K factor RskA
VRNPHALAAAYALDALTDVEHRRFGTHLTECDTCADEVRGMRETAARLAVAASRTPPRRLRERVLAETARTRQVPPRLGRPHRGRHLIWMLSAACLVVAISSGLVALQAHRSKERAHALNRGIAAVMAAPDARTVTTTARAGGSGTVVASRSLGRAVIVMSGLPRLPAERTYELWLIGAGPPRPAGTMRPPAGPVLVTGLGDATRVGVTVEPAAGSPRPTSPPVLTAALP